MKWLSPDSSVVARNSFTKRWMSISRNFFTKTCLYLNSTCFSLDCKSGCLKNNWFFWVILFVSWLEFFSSWDTQPAKKIRKFGTCIQQIVENFPCVWYFLLLQDYFSKLSWLSTSKPSSLVESFSRIYNIEKEGYLCFKRLVKNKKLFTALFDESLNAT